MNDLLSKLYAGLRYRLSWAVSLATLLLASATCSYVAMAAVVSLQPPDNEALLRIPVVLTGDGDEALSGIQFDLNFDASQYTLEAIEASEGTAGAGKEAIISEPTPGTGRVLITGFNNDQLPDGHVATLVLRPRTTEADDQNFSVANFLASDPFGNTVPLGYADAYGYPPQEPEKVEPLPADDETVDDVTAPDGVDDPDVPNVDSSPKSDPATGNAPRNVLSALADLDGAESPSTKRPERPATPTQTIVTDTYTPSRERSALPRFITPRTAIPSRSLTSITPPQRGNNSVAPRGTSRSDVAESPERSNAESGHPSAPQKERLALLLPGRPIQVNNGEASSMGALVVEKAAHVGASPTHRFATFALFFSFFALFAIAHIRLFRWLNRPVTRRRS